MTRSHDRLHTHVRSTVIYVVGCSCGQSFEAGDETAAVAAHAAHQQEETGNEIRTGGGRNVDH